MNVRGEVMNQRKANVLRRPVARHVAVLSVLRSLVCLVVLFMFMAVTRGASAPALVPTVPPGPPAEGGGGAHHGWAG